VIIMDDLPTQLSHVHLAKLLKHSGRHDLGECYRDNGCSNLFVCVDADNAKMWVYLYPDGLWHFIGYYPNLSLQDARSVARWNDFCQNHYRIKRPHKLRHDKIETLIDDYPKSQASHSIGCFGGIPGLFLLGYGERKYWEVCRTGAGFEKFQKSTKIGDWPKMTFREAANIAKERDEEISSTIPKFIPRCFVDNPMNQQAEATAITADIINALEPFISRMVAEKIEKMLGAQNAS